MKANSKNPTLIRVTSNGSIIGHMTTKEFREYMNNKTSFIPELISRFNQRKEAIGEPERVEQVLNAA